MITRVLAVGGLTAALVTGPATAPAEAATVKQRAVSIMNLTYKKFAQAPREKPFEWSTDGCSSPIYDRDMIPACVQHDFGYRNFGNHYALKLEVTRARKDWIDKRFQTEMHRICDHKYTRGSSNHDVCGRNADIMYTAVQLFGDSSYF